MTVKSGLGQGKASDTGHWCLTGVVVKMVGRVDLTFWLENQCPMTKAIKQKESQAILCLGVSHWRGEGESFTGEVKQTPM